MKRKNGAGMTTNDHIRTNERKSKKEMKMTRRLEMVLQRDMRHDLLVMSISQSSPHIQSDRHKGK